MAKNEYAFRMKMEEAGSFERQGYTHFVLQGLVLDDEIPETAEPPEMAPLEGSREATTGGCLRRRLVIPATNLSQWQAAALALVVAGRIRSENPASCWVSFRFRIEKDCGRKVTIWTAINGIGQVGERCAA